MSDGLDAARALLPGVKLKAIEQLQAGDRASVHRVRATWPDYDPTTVIVKQFHQAGEGWTREVAALRSLQPGLASAIVALGAAPPVLITQDLGDGPSVADALLDTDPEPATQAVHRWAEALARLHVASRSGRTEFAAALAEHAGDLPVADNRVSVELDDAVRVLDQHCASLGVPVPSGALDELHGLAQRLGSDGVAALSPADTCPDNNVLVGDRLVLIDFEGAQWRHVAWDAAYLFVPWPTCWCSWQLPSAVAESAFAAYRAVAAENWPQVADEAFARDVEAAVVGWACTSTTWFLGNALGSDPPLNPDRPTPTRRAMIRHRLGVAARSAELPALAELARSLDDELAKRWGDVPLAHAPAFRTGQ